MKTFALLLACAGGAAAQVRPSAEAIVRTDPISLRPVVVTATRAAQPSANVPFSLTAFSGSELRSIPTVTLDGALRSVPGFSLFRRSDSFSANPTAQGVSLRGLGPSGASRSLVLLDGVPLNDPFGGWVTWSKVPRESLATAELVRGGGAAAWGNAALGGVVQLLTDSAGPAPHAAPGSAAARRSYHPEARIAATYGGFATRSTEATIARPLGPGHLQLSGRAFATDGFALVAPEDRGPVDIAAWSRHHWLSARWTQPVGDHATLTVTGRTFREQRGNGTAYQRNSSAEDFGSITLNARPSSDFSWTALAYGQDQSFGSTFSSVNATRTAEVPASDQFAVPATALGAAWTGVWPHPGDSRTSAGVDLRRVRGETREHFTFSAGDFTRERVAGGTQEFAGIFALHERPLANALRITAGARLDAWRETDGHRRENERVTGNVLRDDHYAGRDGVEFSPSAGLVWSPTFHWRIRAAGQQAFRRPTLNELYRPFRVGNVITEANAGLKTERVTSGELGIEWLLPVVDFHGSSATRARLGATLFWNDLRDAVGNVTLFRGPGTFPIVGFVPAGGAGRQRLNLDRLRVQGVELSAEWKPSPWVALNATYLYNDAVVRRSSQAPALAGKRLAQVPRHSASFGARIQLRNLILAPRVRVIGRQFEDDENLLVLGTAAVADLGASHPLGRGELFLTAENLGNTRIETGRSAELVNTGTPRLILGGFRAAW